MNKTYIHIFPALWVALVIVFFNCKPVNAQDYSFRFEGFNNFVTADGVAGKVANKDFTMEYWFRLNATPTDFNSLAAFNQSDKSNRFETGVGYDSDQKFYVYSPYSNPQTTYGTTTIAKEEWYHVAVTYRHSDGNIEAYLNGKLELTKTMDRTYCVKVTDLFSLGQEWDTPDPSAFLKGDLDEFRVWNDLRTLDEIRANMFRELNGNEANLVTYYKMNEGSGITLTDYCNNVSGTLVNIPFWKTSGAHAGPRQALDFDGTDDYVELGDVIEVSTGHTEEAWIKWAGNNSTSSAFQDIILKPYITSIAITNDGRLHANYGNGTQWGTGVSSSIQIPANVWTHIATVRESTGEVKLYINGVEDTNSTTNILSGSNTQSRCIGVGKYGGTPNSNKFYGAIDEVRIWNTTRTASEIRENMMRTIVGNESGLSAYYRFDQTAGATLYDVTVNAYNGTLINMDDATDWLDSDAFNSWIGSESNIWSTTSNWSDGVPTSTDNLGIYKWSLGSETTLSGSPTTNNILFSLTASPSLGSGFTVNGNLILQKNLDLNGQTITLGSNATLIEGAYRLYGSNGSVTTTRSLSNISSQNVAGLGAIITSAANLGNTVITRTHASQSNILGGKSILRTYLISPQNNTGLNATLVYNYLTDELNDISEALLALHKSADAGSTFTYQGGTVNIANNTITLTGIDGFSLWTAASGCVNPTNGGIIGNAQTICTGSTPAMLTETTSPTGTIAGTLQYQWQSSTTSAVADFVDISGATSSTCQPDVLTQTTWYKRLVKVDCETNWLESNVVEVTVNPLQQFRTKAGLDYASPRNWTTTANWEQYNGSSLVAASSYPGEISIACNSPLVTILSGHQMEISGANITLPNLKMEGTGKLFVRSTGKLSVSGQLQMEQNAAGAIIVE